MLKEVADMMQKKAIYKERFLVRVWAKQLKHGTHQGCHYRYEAAYNGASCSDTPGGCHVPFQMNIGLLSLATTKQGPHARGSAWNIVIGPPLSLPQRAVVCYLVASCIGSRGIPRRYARTSSATTRSGSWGRC